LTRLLQIYELQDEDSAQDIFNFIREFKLVKIGNKYINMATKKDFIVKLKELTKLPLTNAMMSQSQYEKIMNYRL
ncbi:MAG: transposase, partial [Erysipelotrichaceae bacterium]|nr:transposase [Erysipelotrichaceae bacterium]